MQIRPQSPRPMNRPRVPTIVRSWRSAPAATGCPGPRVLALDGLGPGRGRAGPWRGCSMPCRLIARHRAHRRPQPAPTHPGRSGRKRACRQGDTTVVHGRDCGNAEACALGCSSMSTLREASCVRSTKFLPFTGFGPPATRGREWTIRRATMALSWWAGCYSNGPTSITKSARETPSVHHVRMPAKR